ncbi:MAG: ABC transporter ATP-binding protein [Candidatus Caldatribacteriaceae bacterium]
MSQPLLEVQDLSVHFRVYGGYLRVLDGVNFQVAPQEKVGLVGETGCGKTTTMKTIMRILPQPPGIVKGGKIFFKGKDLLRMESWEMERVRRREIAMIFQDPTAALNPVFTIGEQLFDVIRYATEKGSDHRFLRDIAIQVLEEVALPDPSRILTNYPVQLSGGMRQRVCIALALACPKELLIADEPGTSLDVTIQDQILHLINKLAEERKMAVILISHSLGVIRDWTDKVWVMYAGTIVEEAPTRELFAQPLHPYTQALLKCVPKLTGEGIAEGIPGRIPDYFDPPSGCRFHLRCPYRMRACSQEKPRLYGTPTHKVACFLYQGQEEEH